MTRKINTSKKYQIFGAIAFITIFSLITCTTIGYFTSLEDDKAYSQMILDDLNTMITDSGNQKYKQLSKMIDFGHFVLIADSESNKIKMHLFKINSPKTIVKKMSNDENVIQFMDETSKFKIDISKFESLSIYNSKTPFISAFGDIFNFRLLPSVVKIHWSIYNLLTKEMDDDSFVVVSLDNNIITITGCKGMVEEKCVIEKTEYYLCNLEKQLSTQKILKHLLYRIFLMNN